MAEVAAGALVVEQAVTTTIEGGVVAAIAIAQPTVPLKASFERIGSAPTSDAPDSLGRSHHTVTYLNHDLCIYGGLVSASKLAGPEVHILNLSSSTEPLSPGEGHTSYKTIPPLSSAGADGPLPPARFGHTAVALPDGPDKGVIAVFGGSIIAEQQSPLDEGGRVWLFDPETLHWKHLDPVEKSPAHPSPRYLHSAVAGPGSSLIVHGGKDASGPKSDTWKFDRVHQAWNQLPSLPVSKDTAAPASSSPPSFAIADDCLYLLTTARDNLSMTLYTLDLAASSHVQAQQGDPPNDFSATPWISFDIPTNPLTSSPSLKLDGAAFLPISTGLGRNYLLHMMGAQTRLLSAEWDEASNQQYSSTIHALRLPSAIHSPASAKDSARDHIPRADSHRFEWHTVDVVAKEEGSSNPTWLDTLDVQQQNVRSTVTQAANVAGSWIKGRARAISNAANDIHIGGVDQPESPAVPKQGPVLKDKEEERPDSVGKHELMPQSPVPESVHEVKTPAFSETATTTSEKDDLPLSTQLPHHIKSGTEAHARDGRVSGKAHPGPRAWSGCTAMASPKVGTVGSGEKSPRVVLWGGLNAKGEREGDGWVVSLRV